jgi:hypothetical protein
MTTDLEQQSLARVAILGARRRRRWKQALFWALMALGCFALQAGITTVLVDPHWAIIIALFFGIISSVIASAHITLGLLLSHGAHKRQLASAKKQAASLEGKTLDPKLLKELVARDLADIETRRSRTSANIARYARDFGKQALLALFFIGLLVGVPAAAWQAAMYGDAYAGWASLIFVGGFLFLWPVCAYLYSALKSANDVREEAGEARQLEQDRSIVMGTRQKMGGDHLSGAISMATDGEDELKGALSSNASAGGLTEVD